MAAPSIVFDYKGTLIIINADEWVRIEEDMMVALNTITTRYIEASGYLAYAKMVLEKATKAYNTYYGVRYHQLKASAYEQLYQRKPTEQSLEYALDEDPTCIRHQQTIADHQMVVDQLYGLIHALDMKLDTLKEIGSHVRQQLRLRDHT